MQDLTAPLRHQVLNGSRGPVFLNREENSVPGKVELFSPGRHLSGIQKPSWF